jgi:hypothetical protein
MLLSNELLFTTVALIVTDTSPGGGRHTRQHVQPMGKNLPELGPHLSGAETTILSLGKYAHCFTWNLKCAIEEN